MRRPAQGRSLGGDATEPQQPACRSDLLTSAVELRPLSPRSRSRAHPSRGLASPSIISAQQILKCRAHAHLGELHAVTAWVAREKLGAARAAAAVAPARRAVDCLRRRRLRLGTYCSTLCIRTWRLAEHLKHGRHGELSVRACRGKLAGKLGEAHKVPAWHVIQICPSYTESIRLSARRGVLIASRRADCPEATTSTMGKPATGVASHAARSLSAPSCLRTTSFAQARIGGWQIPIPRPCRVRHSVLRWGGDVEALQRQKPSGPRCFKHDPAMWEGPNLA